MGTSISLFDQPHSNMPAYLQNFSSNAGRNLMLGGLGRNKIGLKGNRFRMIVNGQEESVLETASMEVVIVEAAQGVARIYFEGNYDADVKMHPLCYSPNGIEPGNDVSNPQSLKCANCPQNQKGSKITPDGTKTKACQYFKRLAVIPLIDPEHRVFQLDCKALTIFGKGQPNQAKYTLNEYAQKLHTRGWYPEQFVTRLSFDTNSSVPKLYFSPVRVITEDEAPWVQEAIDSEETKSIVEIRAVTDTSDAESEISANETVVPESDTKKIVSVAPKTVAKSVQSKATIIKTASAPPPVTAKTTRETTLKTVATPAPTSVVQETTEDEELANFLAQLDSVGE